MLRIVKKIYATLFYHKRYEKFIIVTRSRTGSNLLVSYLNTHNSINCSGEVFSRIGDSNSNQIWTTCFKKHPPRIKWVGFKLFYYHPNDRDDSFVWDSILNDKSIRLIHLTRRNLLRVLVSKKIASKLDYWSDKDGGNELSADQKKVSLSIRECEEEFSKTKDYESSVVQRFSNHAIYHLEYEDLIANPQKEMAEVFRFFGLKPTTVKSDYKKQNPERLEEVVNDFDHLSLQLQNTSWAYLLDLPESN